MLENQEPFKSMLKFFNFCGLWQRSSLSRLHLKIAKRAFVLLIVLPFILAILSLLQDESVLDYVRTSTLIFCSIMNLGYVTTFLLLEGKIQELFDSFSMFFENRPESVNYLSAELYPAYKMEREKFIGVTIWMCMGLITTFILRELLADMWIPSILTDRTDFFYIMWLYQVVFTTYLTYLSVFMQDFFFTFLRVINACMKYLRDELKSLDLNETKAKAKIVQCVEAHLDIRRQMRKYTEIASFPMAIHMLVGAYILCTAAIIISSDVSKKKSIIWCEKLKVCRLSITPLPCP
jgi:hypothetical protein